MSDKSRLGPSAVAGAAAQARGARSRPLPPDPADVASMHGRLVEWLGSRIATGEISGTLNLDQIAAHFQVSRSLVRECLRTLAAKGMVQARQRTGTRVTEPHRWAMLDEQVIRWRAAGPERFEQLHESLELRERLEPLAARRSAERQDPDALAQLEAATRGIEQAIAEDDGLLMIEADTAFHRVLYLGSGSQLLARLAGTVHACLRVPDFQTYQRFSPDTATRHRRLTTLIVAGEASLAEAGCEQLMALTGALFRDAQGRVAGNAGADPAG